MLEKPFSILKKNWKRNIKKSWKKKSRFIIYGV